MITVIVCFIFSIPLYFILFQLYRNPKASLLWGRKWMYEKPPEISVAALKYSRYSALFGIIFITTVFFFLFLSQM